MPSEATVWVNVAATAADSFSIAIRDEGDGFPDGAQFGEGKGLGACMVRALADQLNASSKVVGANPGSNSSLPPRC